MTGTGPSRRKWRLDAISAFALGVLALFVIVSILGLFIPFDVVSRIGSGPRMAAPFTGEGWLLFGTDQLGRPMLARLIQGLQVTFAMGALSAGLAGVVAAIAGLVSGYLGGAFDWVLSRAADLLFTFPGILLALLVIAVLGPGTTGAVISIVLIISPQIFRVVRAQTMVLKPRDFVRAAYVYGAPPLHIMRTHVLPNVMGVLIVQTSSAMVVAMLIESGLSFLGLGVTPPVASLGSLVHDGYQFLSTKPFLVFVPAAILSLAILAVSLAGDWLRDRIEVRDLQVLQ